MTDNNNSEYAIDISTALADANIDSRYISGKQRGVDIRAALRVDAIEADNKKIKVVVPETVRSFSPSFVLGMFSATLNKVYQLNMSAVELVEKFREIYSFERADNSSTDRIYHDIEEGIADFLLDKIISASVPRD